MFALWCAFDQITAELLLKSRYWIQQQYPRLLSSQEDDLLGGNLSLLLFAYSSLLFNEMNQQLTTENHDAFNTINSSHKCYDWYGKLSALKVPIKKDIIYTFYLLKYIPLFSQSLILLTVKFKRAKDGSSKRQTLYFNSSWRSIIPAINSETTALKILIKFKENWCNRCH